MDAQRIRSLLQDALEDEIPSAQIKLWPAVKAALVAGKYPPSQQGARMNTPNTSSPRRAQRASAAAALAVIALLALAFATPQGRALAQSIWQLFTRAEGDTFPLQPSEIVVQTDPAAPTAAPPAPLISLAEAEAQAGFDAAEFPATLEGLSYLGARLYGDAISIEYEAPGGDGHLILLQSRSGFLKSDWDRVPAEDVVPVKIGDVDGEFAQGAFVAEAGVSSAMWNPGAPIVRLRWVKDGVWFELARYGRAESLAHLDQAGLIALAESLTSQP